MLPPGGGQEEVRLGGAGTLGPGLAGTAEGPPGEGAGPWGAARERWSGLQWGGNPARPGCGSSALGAEAHFYAELGQHGAFRTPAWHACGRRRQPRDWARLCALLPPRGGRPRAGRRRQALLRDTSGVRWGRTGVFRQGTVDAALAVTPWRSASPLSLPHPACILRADSPTREGHHGVPSILDHGLCEVKLGEVLHHRK